MNRTNKSKNFLKVSVFNVHNKRREKIHQIVFEILIFIPEFNLSLDH